MNTDCAVMRAWETYKKMAGRSKRVDIWLVTKVMQS